MQRTYKVKSVSPRSFTQQIFFRKGGRAILRMQGAEGVIETSDSISKEDLESTLNFYGLTSVDLYENNIKILEAVPIAAVDFEDEVVTAETVQVSNSTSTTKITKKTSKKATTTLYTVEFEEDL